MTRALLQTLLTLGHATSQNLAYVHAPKVYISYGEETITETNLLEIHRRHQSKGISLNTFTKKQEAHCGADWQWHVIGKKYTFLMLIQAKRVQRDKKIRIKHHVASSGQNQIDLLITESIAKNHNPVYCFYGPESARDLWKVDAKMTGGFEAGCLLASAKRVRYMMPTYLPQIERYSIPWHYLLSPAMYRAHTKTREFPDLQKELGSRSFLLQQCFDEICSSDDTYPYSEGITEFPNIDHLNSGSDALAGLDGIMETAAYREMYPDNFDEDHEPLARRVLKMRVDDFDAP